MGFRGQKGHFGTPLLQIFSVTLKPDDDDTVYQVYGTVQVEDEIGVEYLFNCDPKDAVTIRGESKLLLLTPDRPSFATADFSVTFDLKEKNGNTEFVKDTFTWNGPSLFSYANCCLAHPFTGKLGLATIYFTVLSVAVDTRFALLIKESGAIATNVYGRIVAYYGRNFEFMVDQHNFRVILFDKTCKEEAVELDDEGCIPLLTEYLSVPCYSSLVIEANLHYTRSSSVITEGIIDSKIEIPAWGGTAEQRRDGAFSALVKWMHPNSIERPPSLEIQENEKFHIDGNSLFELFSTRIFYDQATVEGDVEVFGRIRVDDGLNDMSIYSSTSSKNGCNLISPDGTLALTGPSSCIQESAFDLSFDVKERHRKFECHGYISISPTYVWEWFDCFTCAAISGKNCYAVLHFAVFKNAVQAEVEVTLSSSGNTTVHGSLIAFYHNYKYESNYLKNYFQTRLLDVPEDKPMEVSVKSTSAPYCASSVLPDALEDELMPELEDDSTVLKDASQDTLMPESEKEPVELKHESATDKGRIISLSRKVVAVPDKSSLKIEANLTCNTSIGILETATHLVSGLANFDPQTSGTTSARIGGKDVFIDVKVSWSNYSYYNPGKKLSIDTKRPSSVEVSSEKKNKFNSLI